MSGQGIRMRWRFSVRVLAVEPAEQHACQELGHASMSLTAETSRECMCSSYTKSPAASAS